MVNLAAVENNPTESVNEKAVEEFATIIPFDEPSKKQLVTQLQQLQTVEEKSDFLTKIADDLYKEREKQVGETLMRQVDKFVMLSVIDNLWMNHLDAMDNLRSGIGLRGYAQKDPLVEYKNEGFRMFESLMSGIDDEVAHRIYKIQIQTQQHTHEDGSVHDGPAHQTQTPEQIVPQLKKPRQIITNAPASEVSEGAKKPNSAKAQGEGKSKLSRNDPCPCGSGKKWKKCHYPDIP